MREKIQTAVKKAMKSGDTKALGTLRLIAAGLKDRDIAARGQGNSDGISHEDILAMLQTMIKQRQESIKMYRDGGREELAQSEEGEIEIIKIFLPKQMSASEIEAAITEAVAKTEANSIKDMGKVMAHLKQNYAGKMDFAIAAAAIKAQLLGE